MSYAAFDSAGNILKEPGIQEMKRLLATASSSPDDLTPVMLAHQKGWLLSYNRSKTMGSDRFFHLALPAGGERASHMKDIPEDVALELWTLLARGEFEKLHEETGKWAYGYGIFSEEVKYGVYYIPGVVTLNGEVKSKEFIAFINEKSTKIHCKVGPQFDLPLINDQTLDSSDVRESKLIISAHGNCIGKVDGHGGGYGMSHVGSHTRRITQLDFILTYLEDATEFVIGGRTSDKYDPWTVGEGYVPPEGSLEFSIRFTVLDQELNKVMRTGYGSVANRFLWGRRHLVFRDKSMQLFRW